MTRADDMCLTTQIDMSLGFWLCSTLLHPTTMSRPYTSSGRPPTASDAPHLDPRYQYPETPTTASTSASDVQWAFGAGSQRPYTGAGDDLYEEDEYVESEEDDDVFAYLPPTTAEAQGELLITVSGSVAFCTAHTNRSYTTARATTAAAGTYTAWQRSPSQHSAARLSYSPTRCLLSNTRTPT